MQADGVTASLRVPLGRRPWGTYALSLVRWLVAGRLLEIGVGYPIRRARLEAMLGVALRIRTASSLRSGRARLLGLLSIWQASRGDNRVVCLEGDDLVREERSEDYLVELLGLREVLVVDVTRLGRVDADEIILSLVLYERISYHFSDAAVESSDLLDRDRFLLVADPVLWVPSPPILIITANAVLRRGRRVRIVLT